jgi:hypothetical protein
MGFFVKDDPGTAQPSRQDENPVERCAKIVTEPNQKDGNRCERLE